MSEPGRRSEAIRIPYLIARREFVTRVRSRFFLVGTGILAVLVLGFVALQVLVIDQPRTVTVGFVGGAQLLAQPLRVSASTERLRVETTLVADAGTGENEVRAGRLDVLVSGDPTAPDVMARDQLDPTVASTLRDLARQATLDGSLVRSGLDPAAVDEEVATSTIHPRLLDPNASQRTQRQVAAGVAVSVLYTALMLYGQLIAIGVVEEKANRIVEILLSTVRPAQLLIGKVAGIGLLGILQLVIVGAVAVVAATQSHLIQVPVVGLTAALDALLWFTLGFVLYALLYAAAGSMVSRQEDLASATMPVTGLVIASYVASVLVDVSSDSPIGTAASVIPPFAAMLMPVRMAIGDAPAWQVVLAAGLTVAAIAGLAALASRIYATSVLRVGSRVGLIDALRGSRRSSPATGGTATPL